MLIYSDNGSSSSTPFEVASYKSTHNNRQRSSIRAKVVKCTRRSLQKKRRKVEKKVEKSKKLKSRTASSSSKRKKLNAENIKFLKTLGLRIKK